MRFLFLFIGISFCFAAASQKKKLTVLFEQAEKQVEDSLYQDAIQTYRKIRKVAAYNSDGYAKATYNIAYTYALLHKKDSAISVYEEIIDSDFDEMDPGGKGSGIMADPYSLYKHNACDDLAHIYLEKKNYSKALSYIQLFDSTFPFRHFCGNAYASYDIYKAEMYAKVYAGLGDTISAIQKLLPEIMETGLADNSSLVDMTVELLKRSYDKYLLKEELENAVNGIYQRKAGPKKEYDLYFIKFLGTELQLPTYVSLDRSTRVQANQLTEIERRKLFLKQSRFYKSLQ